MTSTQVNGIVVSPQQYAIIDLLLKTGIVKNGNLTIHFDLNGQIVKIEKTEYYKP